MSTIVDIEIDNENEDNDKLILNNNNLLDSKNIWKTNINLANKISVLCSIEHPKAISIIEDNINNLNHNYCLNSTNCDICNNILTCSTCQYMCQKRYYCIDWYNLSENLCAVELLKKNIDKICWKRIIFNKNPEVKTLIEQNLDKTIFHKPFFSDSPHVDVLEGKLDDFSKESLELSGSPLGLPKKVDKYYDDINWDSLSFNRHNINLLKNNQHKINWDNFSYNTSKDAIEIIEQNLDKINWSNLSHNMNAVHLLEKNIDKIDWEKLELNMNAVHLIEERFKNSDYIPGSNFSKNPNALTFLKKYPQCIDWNSLKWNKNCSEAAEIFENNLDQYDGTGLCLMNYHIYLRIKDKFHLYDENTRKKIQPAICLKNIFELDLDFIQNKMNLLKKDLIQKTWHPNRFQEWCLSLDELNELKELIY